MTRGADWYSFHATIDPIDTVEQLAASWADPQQRWFARRRAQALIASGLLGASSFNANLHPRGRDGKFIEKFGFVRWFDPKELAWHTGWVSDIDGTNGQITVREQQVSGAEKVLFPNAKNLYSRPKPKALLDLPDPVTGKLPDNFKKVGGQGGSNPGGMYQIDGSFADDPPDISKNSKMFRTFATFRQPGTYSHLADSFDPTAPAESIAPSEVDAVMVPRVDGTLDRYEVLQRFGSKWYRVPTSGQVTVDDMMRPELEVSAADAFGEPGSARRFKVVADLGTFGITRGSAFDVEDMADAVQQTGSPLPKAGDKYYVKKMDIPERARSEALANDFYELLGIPVPEVAVGSDGKTISSKLVGDTVPFDKNNPAHIKAAQDGFLADAWIANWDVTGQPVGDNLQVDSDGNVWRIDAGGSLEYRAKGTPKGAMFGDNVGELDSLRNATINPTASKVFGGISNAQLLEQATVLQSVSPADIQHLADRHDMSHVGPVMIARRKSILDQVGVVDPPPAIPDPTPTPKTVYNPAEHVKQMGSPPTVAVSNWNTAVNALPYAVVGPSDWDDPDLLNVIWKRDGDLWVYQSDLDEWSAGHHNGLFRNLFTGEVKRFSLADGEDQYLTSYDKNIDEALIDNASVTRDLAIAEIVARTTDIPLDDLMSFNVNKPDDPDAMTYGRVGLANWATFNGAIGRGRLGKDNDRPLMDGNGDLFEVVSVFNDSNGEGVILKGKTGTVSQGAGVVVSSNDWKTTGPWFMPNNDTTAAIWKSKYAPDDIDGDDPDGASLAEQSAISVEQQDADDELALLGPDGGLNVPADDGISDVIGVPTADEELEALLAQEQAIADALADAAPASSQKIVNDVVAGLSPGTPILSTEMAVSDLDEIKAQLVGKHVVLLPIEAHDNPDWDGANVGPGNGLGTVTDVAQKKIYVPGGYDANGKWDTGKYEDVVAVKVSKPYGKYVWVASGEHAEYKKSIVPVETAPVPQQVTFKKNGDVFINGTKVGFHWPPKTHPAGKSHPNYYSYSGVIDGDHSVTGKPMSFSSAKLTGAKEGSSSLVVPITPPPTKPKSAKIVATEQEIKDLNLMLSTTEFAIGVAEQELEELAKGAPSGEGNPLNDGSKPAKGDWVFSTKDGTYAQVLNPNVVGFAGKGVLSPDMIKVKIQDPVTGKWKQSNRKREQLVSVAGPGEPPFVTQTKALQTSNGDWLGPGVSIAVAGGTGVSAGKVMVLDTTVDGKVKYLAPDGTQHWAPVKYAVVLSDVPKVKVPAGKLDQAKIDALNAELAGLNDEKAKLVATIASTVVGKPKKKKPIGVPYPGPGGSTFKQPSWLAEQREAKGLKNMKDGYVPTPGMIVRHNDGSQYVVVQLGDEWSSHKNSVSVAPIDKPWDWKWRALSTLVVDHETMLTDKAGAPLPIISTVEGADWAPDSGLVLSKSWQNGYYAYDPATGKQMYRTKDMVRYFIVGYDGAVYNADGTKASHASVAGSDIERIGYLDKSHQGGKTLTVSVQQHHNTQVGQIQYAVIHDPGTPAGIPLAKQSTAAPTSTPPPAPVVPFGPGTVPTNVTPVTPAPTIPGTTFVAPPTAPGPALPTPTPPIPTSTAPTPADELPVFAGANPSGMELPHPPTVSSTTGVPAFQSQGGTQTLDNAGLAGAHSVSDAVAQTLGVAQQNKKDGTKKWVSTYGLGDSDTIEDMLVRTQTVRDAKGDEYVEASFRLEKDAAKKAHTSFMVTATNEVGDWEPTTRNAKNMVPGDAVSVRVASGGGVAPAGALRPDENGTLPNATVVAAPVLVGKNKERKDAPAGTYDVYRTQVMTAGGEIGFIDLEDRNSADTINVFAWDPLKARQTSGAKALNPNAQADGWKVKSNQLTWAKSNGWQKSDIQADGVKAMGTSTSSAAPYSGSQQENQPFGKGWVLERDVNGVHIEYATAPAKNSLDGHTVIRVRADDPDAQQKIADAMELVGVSKEAQKPPTREVLTQLAANKVYEQFNPTYSRGMTANGGVQQALDAIDAAVGKELGRKATIDDISLRIAKDGRVQVLVSEDVSKAVVAKNHVNAYVHGFKADDKVDMLEAIFAGESSAIMSSTERFQHGVFYTGMSSGADHGHDSADHLFLTLYKTKSSKGNGSAVVDPVAMHRHTDYYFREGDRFGTRESDQLNWLNKPVDGGELMIQRRFEMDLISYVVVSEPERTNLIKKLHKRGITTAPNGMQLEKFLVTSPPAFYSVDFGDEVPLGSLPDDGTPVAGAPAAMAGV